LFDDWFENCFVPEVKIFLKNKKIAFKVFLVVEMPLATKRH
jgi:hypothetical protein